MNKGSVQNFFEDFEMGQTFDCPTPRVLTNADRVAYIAFTGDRTPGFCNTRGLIHPLIVLHTVLGQTVRQISLNAQANLGYAEMIWGQTVSVGDERGARVQVVGLKENSNQRTGIVYVKTTGMNQREETVLEYFRSELGATREWEECRRMGGSFGYSRNESVDEYKPATDLIHLLIETASKGGCLLLDIGPTADGRIPVIMQQRLVDMGEWLKVNGDAIYGSTYGPLQDLKFGRTTAKGKTIYLHIFDWPKGPLEVEGLTAKVSKAVLLAGNKPVSFTQKRGKLTLELPDQAPDPHASVIALATK